MSKSNKNISVQRSPEKQEELKDFLKDNLSDDLLHALENSEDDAFIKDALEGLSAFSSTDDIKKHAHTLNKKLIKTAGDKKKSKALQPSQILFTVITIVTILLLLMLAYAVIGNMR